MYKFKKLKITPNKKNSENYVQTHQRQTVEC